MLFHAELSSKGKFNLSSDSYGGALTYEYICSAFLATNACEVKLEKKKQKKKSSALKTSKCEIFFIENQCVDFPSYSGN